MADLTGETPLQPDIVQCDCGRQWDRNIYTQCGNCTANLWDLGRFAPGSPPADPARGANDTVLERDSLPTPGIDILVCGRRLTIAEGQTLRLGRRDDLETADVFRDAANISREHATLRLANGQLHVTDTRSSNGTYVDGQGLPPEHEYEIRKGQTLRLASNVAIDILWEGQ